MKTAMKRTLNMTSSTRRARRIAYVIAAALGFSLLANAGLAYERTVTYGGVPGNRPRRLNRTWIFAERECYYPSQNLLHRYTDRQLFLDTRLRNDPRGSIASFLHDVDIAHNAGFDGIGSLDYLNVHRSQLRMMNVYPPPDGYTQMMVIPAYFKEEDLPRLREHILAVAKSPYTTRLDGKLVFWAYGGGTEGQQKWARLLRADPAIPPFLFIGDMPFFDMYQAYGIHEKARVNPHPIPEEEVAAFRRKVMAAAEVLDGFQVWHTEYYTDHFGEYPRRSGATDIYRKYLLPAALAAAEKHRARGFMLGAFVRQGYVNPFAGTTDGEYGTATLRAYLDELSLLNPDMIMGFEWNEFNENTHFQPTVAHGRTWERILAYYRALLDRDIPRPRPGDDTSVPNVIVSVRQALKLGEPWHLELLGIPDGTAPTNVLVRATLTDARGATLLEFPEENLPTDRIVAIDYRVPSEKLTEHDAVCVTVETVYNGKRVKWQGFDCTRIHPTICRDYLYSNHPLREMLVPGDVKFSAVADKDGMYSISATISSPEKLSSFEILEGVQEKAAADPDDEFDRTKYVTVRGRFQTGVSAPFGPGIKSCLRGSARFRNAPNARLRAGHYAWSPFNVYGETNGVWRVGSNFTGGTGTFFAIVPKNELDKAALDFDFPKLGKFSCDLADVALRGRKSMRLPDTVNLELDRVEDLPDSPRPLESLHAEVSAVLPSDGRFPVWQARAITMSGKIWRSRPVCPDRKGEKMRELTLFSDTERKPIKASVAESRVPDFRYEFDSRDGARLPCPSDRRFDAMLGDSNVYADYAFGARHPKGIPEGCRMLEPEWTTTAEGRRALCFDGVGSRLVLPIEAVPHGAEYALEFEIRPDTADNQVLLRTSYASERDCGLTVTVEDGTLRVSHFGILIVPRHFNTEAAVNPGQWNRIRIEKRYEKIVCTVNGKTKSFGYDRRARRFAPVIFGGDNSPGPGIPPGAKAFKGLLRSIRVHHAVDWDDGIGPLSHNSGM